MEKPHGVLNFKCPKNVERCKCLSYLEVKFHVQVAKTKIIQLGDRLISNQCSLTEVD